MNTLPPTPQAAPPPTPAPRAAPAAAESGEAGVGFGVGNVAAPARRMRPPSVEVGGEGYSASVVPPFW